MKLFKIITIGFAVCISSTVEMAMARSQYLTTWQESYPSSTSDDASCQLCHQNAGNPWNAYGWDLRQEWVINGSVALAGAAGLAIIEPLDSDGNPAQTSNINEINANTQPGWTEGATNTIYFKNGSTLTDQLPPTLSTDLDPISFSVPVHMAWVGVLGFLLAWAASRVKRGSKT